MLFVRLLGLFKFQGFTVKILLEFARLFGQLNITIHVFEQGLMKLEKLILVKCRPNKLKLNSNSKIETVVHLLALQAVELIEIVVLLTNPA